MGGTGASQTGIPEDILNQLGTLPMGQWRHRLAGDSVVFYPWSQARVRLLDQELVVVVEFLPLGSDPVMGASTPGSFGLGVDPTADRLIDVDEMLKR